MHATGAEFIGSDMLFWLYGVMFGCPQVHLILPCVMFFLLLDYYFANIESCDLSVLSWLIFLSLFLYNTTMFIMRNKAYRSVEGYL
jgi:hypothetical protein